MTKYILHGGFTREENDSNTAFFEEFIKDVLNNGKILMVYFASEDQEALQSSLESQTKRLQENFAEKKFKYLGGHRRKFFERIKKC